MLVISSDSLDFSLLFNLCVFNIGPPRNCWAISSLIPPIQTPKTLQS